MKVFKLFIFFHMCLSSSFFPVSVLIRTLILFHLFLTHFIFYNIFKEEYIMKTRRIFFTFIGNLLIGIGVAGLNLSGFGVDSFTSMTIGLSSLLNISLGLFQGCVNLLLFIPVIFFNRKSFGLGSIVNMFLLGYIVEYLGKFLGLFGITADALHGMILVRIILMFVSIIILCLGCAIYMDCGLGTGPYDAIAPIIEEKTHGKIPFKYARILCDLTTTIIGFLSGYAAGVTTVGIATLCIVIMTGPIVAFFRKKVTLKLIYKGKATIIS